MSAERQKILEMYKAEKITLEEADQLLGILAQNDPEETDPAPFASVFAGFEKVFGQEFKDAFDNTFLNFRENKGRHRRRQRRKNQAQS